MCRAAPTGKCRVDHQRKGDRPGVRNIASLRTEGRAPDPVRWPDTSRGSRAFLGRAATWVGAHPPCRGVRRSEAREVAAGAERPCSDEAWSGSHAAGVRPDEKSAACAILNRASRPHGAVWLGTRTGQQSRRGAADQLAMVSVSAGPRDPRSSQALPNRPGGSHGVRTDMHAHQGAPARLDPNPPYCVGGRKVPSRRPVGGIGVCRDTINVDGEIVSEGGRPKRHLRWSTSPRGRYTLGSELLR